MKHKRLQHGFTLIEILIALTIFAIIAVLAASVLSITLKGKERLTQHANELSQVNLALILIERDLQQMIVNPIPVTGIGNSMSVISRPQFMEFTRVTTTRLFSVEKHTDLLRVSYSVDDHKLYRNAWPADAHAVRGDSPRMLLTDVKSFTIGYLGYGQGFSDTWGPTSMKGINAEDHDPIPRAIAITITFEDGRQLARLIPIPLHQRIDFEAALK